MNPPMLISNLMKTLPLQTKPSQKLSLILILIQKMSLLWHSLIWVSLTHPRRSQLKEKFWWVTHSKKILKEKYSVTDILTELAAIQQQGPKKYCILGTRHCSFLHQQIIELLSYALVLSENHVYTSGAGGTNAAAIRGALRAERPDLLTVILPQSLHKQPNESQELMQGVTDLVSMPQNDELNLDVASRLCNSKLLSETDQLIAFAFHESTTVIEATKEAKKLDMLVTTLFLD